MTCCDRHTAWKGWGMAWNLPCEPQTYLLASLVQTERAAGGPQPRGQASVPTP